MNQQTTSQEHQHGGLNRSINLATVPVELIVWITIAIVALGTSLIGRTNWPLSPEESVIARDAWAWLQGNDLSAAADSHPAIVQLTTFMFFLFGDTDFTARLVPLIGGIAMLGVLYWLRSWFGAVPAISIAAIWAISPVMSLSLVRLDGGLILAVTSLLAFVLTASMAMSPGRGRAIVLGIAFGTGITANPLGWIVVPLSMIASMILIRDVRFGGQALVTIASAIATIVVISSWWLTRVTAPVDFLSQSIGSLWNDHISSLGAVMQAPIITLMVDEPLLLLLSVIGVVVLAIRPDWQFSAHPAVLISCIAWALPMMTVGLIAAGKGPALYAATMFPLVVVAGLGLSLLIDGVRANLTGEHRPLLWAGIALALAVAIVRFADLLSLGPEGDTAGWLVNVLAVALLILVPLGYLIIRYTAGTGWAYVPIGLLTVVIIFGGIGFRTSVMLPDTSQDRPGDLLRAGNTSPGVGSLQHRLRTFSRDATTHIRDVRDPTGGHGLMIVVHRDLADPIAWYFRDFPNLAIVEDAGDVPAETAPDAAFLPQNYEEDWMEVFDQHEGRPYAFRHSEPAEIPASALNGLMLSAVNPAEFRNLFVYTIQRSNPALLEQDSMVLMLREDHAQPFWGTGSDGS